MKFMLRRIAIEDASTGQFFHRPMWIFVTAFLLRTAVMATLFAHSQFTWGVNESAGIARSIVEGHGFSSAFHVADGPTAWLAPVYPALIAAIFRFLGIESVASAGVAVLFNVIFSSLTAVLLVRLGREQLGETAGVVAGWCWAIAPPLLVMPWLPWETCLSALVLMFAFLTTLKFPQLVQIGRLDPVRHDLEFCGAAKPCNARAPRGTVRRSRVTYPATEGACGHDWSMRPGHPAVDSAELPCLPMRCADSQ